MTLISLEPEFIVNPNGSIEQGVLLLDGALVSGIAKTPPVGAHRIRLQGRMILPGFVNVHSHALQRALRGRVEQKHTDTRDDFWSWRTCMYKDTMAASLDDIEAIATLAYYEMLKSGFVAVGEFNYLHHQPTGVPYEDVTTTSRRLVAAAQTVGIRQVLLTCAYERKNYREALLPAQKRFAFASAADFLDYAREIRANVHSPLLSHGLAVHSTRACSGPFIEEVCNDILSRTGPLHMHACEQTQEVQEAHEEYGTTPVEALHRLGALRSNSTLIHATHLDEKDIDLIAQTKAVVGLCPSTERNLGDGLCPIEALFERAVPLSIGTDQHVRLDPVQELRDLEEQERLRLKKRCVIAQPAQTIAESLIPIGTINGRRSLGLSCQDDWASHAADLVAVALPSTYQVNGPKSALNEWIVSGNHRDVTDVFVNGEHMIREGAFRTCDVDILKNANAALKRLIQVR